MTDAVSRAGQLAEECDRFGLPHDVSALVRHIEGNRAMTEAALAMSNSVLREKLDAAVKENERLREALLRAISIIHDFSSGAPMPKGERPCKPLHAALGGDNGEWCDIGSKVGAFTDRQPAGAALTGEEE